MTEPFVAWPGWRHLAYAARLTVLVTILFMVVFGATDYVTGQRAHHLGLFVPAELAIPLWPPAILLYDSLYVLFLMAPFILRTGDAYRRLAITASATILISGLCFLLIPAKLGFAAPIVTGPFKAIFELSDRINLDYNLVPSLHVGLAVVFLLAFLPRAPRLMRGGLIVWGLALASSTLFTHQHHVIDVAAGAGVAWTASVRCGLNR